ncbi:MAG: ABC transporter permease [Dehalococcoidia bacterium]
MLSYILTRLIWLVPTLLAMSLITFILMHMVPGSPLDLEPERNPLPPDVREQMAKNYGLDKPLAVQYLIFLKNAVQGDFGVSYLYKTREVTDIIKEGLPKSLLLGTLAMGFAIVGGLALGIIAAMNQNGAGDYLASILAMLAISLPSFVLAVFAIVIFTFWLGWLPTGGWSDTNPKFWILPALVLGLGPLAVIARYTRSSIVEVIGSDYVRTARAKGLREQRVVIVHVVKNALIPVITIMGPLFAAVATGSYFVEAIFRVPGIGRFFVLSMINRDYSMIMAIILLYGAVLAIMNLVVDLLYAWVDPRIRYS